VCGDSHDGDNGCFPAFVQPGECKLLRNVQPGVRKTSSKERALGNCGVENNPLFRDKLEGPILVRRARRKRVLESDVFDQAGRARGLGSPGPS
jgi:hypothetical protein